MASTIGIKIANGEFYPVMGVNSTGKKRLILTTVHNKQSSVRIDLYKFDDKSNTRTTTDALYIGSLAIENITPKPSGGPSIELVISAHENGDLRADAMDLEALPGGERHSLKISLKSLNTDNQDHGIPDFELEQQMSPPMGLYDDYEKSSKKFPLVIVLILLVIAAVGILVFFPFLFPRRGALDPMAPQSAAAAATPPQEAPPLNASEPAVPEVIPIVPPVQHIPQEFLLPEPVLTVVPEVSTPGVPAVVAQVIQAPAKPPPPPQKVITRQRSPAPVAGYKVPATIPRSGVPYKIRWGDTLWDVSEAFYRNPWLYPRIARFNKIRNPDHIISGTTIRIPPRN
ncbi:MAG: LysM peptidoglycan-binding domain-containing protein [Treponema sp.]|nr:LysM peptidoglycan-binding domain-containing protein [Treponema sp.]